MARRHEDYKLFIEIWQTADSVQEVSRRLKKNRDWPSRYAVTAPSLHGVANHLRWCGVELKYLPPRTVDYNDLSNFAKRINHTGG